MEFNGLILFAHGARDELWAEPFHRLRGRVASASPETRVVLAFLELMTPDLESAVGGLESSGCRSIMIVPVFFGQGGHVRHDLPRLVAQIAHAHPATSIRCTGAIGEDAKVLDALAEFCLRSLKVFS